MIDLNFGENYQKEILLKKKIEEELAKKLDVQKDFVMLNYGSNSNLILFFSAFSNKCLKEKKRPLKVLLDYPNYFFTINQLKEWDIQPISIKRDRNMNFPIKEFTSSINKADVILLTTPNNPTGKPISDKDIIQIIQKTPKETIVLIDRSCINTLPEISTKEIIHRFNKKIVILHSFSKSHNLSDERIGYLVTNNKEIAKFLFNKRDLNHNIHAVERCLEAINNRKIVEMNKKRIKDCNNLLNKFFKNNKDFIYLQSSSNFALISLPNGLDSKIVEENLKKKGILVMGGHKLGLGNRYIRVHMTGIKEITKFLNELVKIPRN